MSEVNYITSFDQVGLALIEKLSGLTIDEREVPVEYFDPDLDLGEAEYPLIVIYKTAEMPDNQRWGIDPIRDNPKYVNGKLESTDVRDHPEPWNLFYAVRLYTDYQQDLDTLKFFFRKKFPRIAYLEIEGVKYDVFHVDFSIPSSEYRDFGTVEEGKREFSEQYLIKVEVNLDLSDRVTVPTAKEFHFNIHRLGIREEE